RGPLPPPLSTGGRTMRRTALTLLLLGALAGGARASDRIGAFALVDKVVFEPDARAPRRVQVWGTFTLVKDTKGRSYTAPPRGYLYYSAEPGKEVLSRREWADFRKVAGTGEVVGFGRSSQRARIGNLRKPDQNPDSPDPYPLNFG